MAWVHSIVGRQAAPEKGREPAAWAAIYRVEVARQKLRSPASIVVPVSILEKVPRLAHDLADDLGGRLDAHDFEHALPAGGHVHLFEVARVAGGNEVGGPKVQERGGAGERGKSGSSFAWHLFGVVGGCEVLGFHQGPDGVTILHGAQLRVIEAESRLAERRCLAVLGGAMDGESSPGEAELTVLIGESDAFESKQTYPTV